MPAKTSVDLTTPLLHCSEIITLTGAKKIVDKIGSNRRI